MARIGSLFAGIGGLELGLEWAGLGSTVWQVEQDPFCRRVLARHWPMADRSVTDVRAACASNLGPVDTICGGFPCQDVSVAGDGAGLDGARSGLWYQFQRIVGELRPRVAIIENVAHGRGRYLCAVRSGLRELGYDSTALLVSAGEMGAPHLRDRCFVVAYPHGEPLRQRAERQPARRARGVRAEGQAQLGHAGPPSRRGAEPGVGGGAHGLAARLDGARWPAAQGEPRGVWEPAFAVTPGPHHAERLTAIGNAVAPWSAAVVGVWVGENVPGPW